MNHLPDCDGNGSVPCWFCMGEGGFHDCGEDCCCCAEPVLDIQCDECSGTGYVACPACAEQEAPCSA